MAIFDDLRIACGNCGDSNVDADAISVLERLSNEYRDNMKTLAGVDSVVSDSITWCTTLRGDRLGLAIVPRFLVFCRADQHAAGTGVESYEVITPKVNADIVIESFRLCCEQLITDGDIPSICAVVVTASIRLDDNIQIGEDLEDDSVRGLVAMPFLHVHSGATTMMTYIDGSAGVCAAIDSNKKILIRMSDDAPLASDIVSLTRYWAHRVMIMNDQESFYMPVRHHYLVRPGVTLALSRESLIVAVNATVVHGLLCYDPTSTVFIAHGFDHVALIRNVHLHEAMAKRIDACLPLTETIIATVNDWGKHILALLSV